MKNLWCLNFCMRNPAKGLCWVLLGVCVSAVVPRASFARLETDVVLKELMPYTLCKPLHVTAYLLRILCI